MSESGTIELACLGRPFQLGMLYDCRTDALIPGISLWDFEMLKKNINIRPQPNTDFKIIAADSSEDKVAALNVSASLEASFLSGLVSVKGSADYLNDNKKSKHQSRVTLQYRTTSRFEQLTMEHLGTGNVKHCNVFQEGSATHVVTALLYGAQAFFIFDREVSSNENHQEIQGDLEASIKKIPSISIEGQASLKMNEMEQEKINKFSCTFHGDFALDNNPVSYVDAIKVYSELPKLLGEHRDKAVPLIAWLYPLKKLDSAAAKLVREISVSLIRCAQRIMDELEDFNIQCQDLMRDDIAIRFPEINDKIRKFKDLLSEYKTVLQKHLSRLLPSIRGGGKEEQELADYLNRNKRSPFKGALVTKYLNEREREMNVVRSYLDIMKDVPVISSSNELDKVVLKVSNNYVIAFTLSSLNEDEPYLSDLGNYLNEQSCNNEEQVSYNLNSSKKTEKWFCSGDVTAITRENIQAFLDFKEANKGKKNIEFCIASIPDELSTASSIHVYERGRLISSQYELPSKPPMPVFLSAEHDCIHLQIKAPDRGVSCVDSYCISYQSAESTEWTEVYTDGVADQVTVKQLQPHKEYCFTCKAVCRPGVSLTSDTTSFFRTRPCAPPGAPIVKQVVSESATLVWDVPTSVGEGVLITGYVLEFRECTKEHENEKPWKSVKSTNRECILHDLKRETDFTVRVSAICVNDEMSLPSSETVFSACFKSKHSGEVGSGLFKNQSSRIHKGNPSIYKLELHQKMKKDDFNQYVFGRKVEDVKNKVILLLGSTGAGKTTLINVMVNYMLGVKWQDPYRFKLINEVTNRTQAESQTPNVSSYELYSQPGFQIPYSLTIVDTPGFGDTKGITQDKLITKQVKSFLCSPLGIDHIDAVCLVVQASLVRLSANQKYIFDSVLSIFGKDIAENIIILVTFADGKDVPVLEAIKAADLPCKKNRKGQPTHFKFNNTAVYADKRVEKHTTVGSDSDDDEDDDQKLNEIVCTSTFKQMKTFFKTLGTIESKDLTQTIKVLEERERLEKAMTSLTPQITAGLSKLSEIKRFQQCLENQNDKMNQNENFEQEIEVMKANRAPANCFNMNCNTCFFTCHSNCFLPAEDPVQTCAVMENDHCIICPGNCHYSFHSKENFMWTYETKVEIKTIKELKENFMEAKGQFMDTKQMLEALEKDFCGIKDKLMKLIRLSSDCLKRLDAIALKPNSLSIAEYLEILIKTEKEEKRPGFEDRIVELKKLKKDTLLLEKIARGEDLLVNEL
uniref:Fibronectin type-III domain-containing protein n=1 Tax=Cyprinus carpio TaxID=7962 RepID=A0A8C1SZA7_CYPCA